MDMWNWLHECYDEGSLTVQDLEKVMADERAARALWEDWAADAGDFVDITREEVSVFIRYLKVRQLRK